MLAAAAAATAIVGAVVMRHWDVQAGKQVADLTRARAGDEWRFEERVAELESDLEESRELRVKLEQRLRAKRAELAGLRNEHAALLRRYATAETERASALEGRRLLEIEAAPSPASLPAARGPQDTEPTEPSELTGAEAAKVAEAGEALPETSSASEATEESEASGSGASGESAEESEPVESVESSGSGEGSATSAVFSPRGSQLFLRAQAALARLDADGDAGVEASDDEPGDDLPEGPAKGAAGEGTARVASAEAAQEDEAEGKPGAVDEHTRATAPHPAADDEVTGNDGTEGDATGSDGGTARQARPDDASSDASSSDVPASAETSSTDMTATDLSRAGVLPEDETDSGDAAVSGGTTVRAAAARQTDGARTARPGADRDPDPDSDPDPGPGPGRGVTHAVEPAAAAATEAGAVVRRPAAPVQRLSGHFAVPTAVAVVPAAEPVRRPTVEGGFDFFGTKSDAEPDALEAVQNEDLADVVGQEALALHKAESEAEFKPADEAARGVGQVIDLTAHDETEHIDLQGLRSAVS